MRSMPKIADDVMNKIEERLQGTCDDVDDAAEEFGVGPIDVLEALGSRGNIEKCTACSWWCEIGEMGENSSSEPVCSDCGGE